LPNIGSTKVQKVVAMYIIDQRFMGLNTITMFLKNIATSLELEKKLVVDEKRR
jgi:hypothetical protein